MRDKSSNNPLQIFGEGGAKHRVRTDGGAAFDSAQATHRVRKDAPDEKRAAILATLRAIPKGHVTSYSAVAERAGLPGYTRFVCRVLRELEDRRKIPWWRVIRRSGHFAMSRQNSGGREQRRRLAAEGITIEKDRVRGPWW